MIRLWGLRKTDEYRWGSYEADASPTMVNVTAAVSDRRRGKRPPRLTAYAYVQRRAAPGVTRHYTFAACYLSRVRENERSRGAAPGGNADAMDHGPWAAQRWRQFSCPPRCLSRLRLCAAPKREEYPPTTPCICDSLNEHRLTGGERHGLGLNP